MLCACSWVRLIWVRGGHLLLEENLIREPSNPQADSPPATVKRNITVVHLPTQAKGELTLYESDLLILFTSQENVRPYTALASASRA